MNNRRIQNEINYFGYVIKATNFVLNGVSYAVKTFAGSIIKGAFFGAAQGAIMGAVLAATISSRRSSEAFFEYGTLGALMGAPTGAIAGPIYTILPIRSYLTHLHPVAKGAILGAGLNLSFFAATLALYPTATVILAVGIPGAVSGAVVYGWSHFLINNLILESNQNNTALVPTTATNIPIPKTNRMTIELIEDEAPSPKLTNLVPASMSTATQTNADDKTINPTVSSPKPVHIHSLTDLTAANLSATPSAPDLSEMRSANSSSPIAFFQPGIPGGPAISDEDYFSPKRKSK